MRALTIHRERNRYDILLIAMCWLMAAGLFGLTLWACYAAVSLYWAIDLPESAKAFVHLLINFIGFGELIWLASKAQRPQHSVLVGWALMFMTTVPIALHELMTDNHLPMSLQESDYYMKLGGRAGEGLRFRRREQTRQRDGHGL